MPGKTQLIRLLDVFLFGPYMINASLDKRLPDYYRLGLGAVGLGTIIYNGINLLKVYQAEQATLGNWRSQNGRRRRGLRAPDLNQLRRYSVNL